MKKLVLTFALIIAAATASARINDEQEIDRLQEMMHGLVISGLPRAMPFQPLMRLEVFQVYKVSSGQTNWDSGYNTVFIGARKPMTVSPEFLTRLRRHIGYVQMALSKYGLNGYVVMPSADYEIAFQSWESPDALAKAIASPEYRAIAKDAGEFMDTLRFRQGIPNPFKP